MPRPAKSTASSKSKKHRLTLDQLSAYDDILTDGLVDKVYYWTTVPKNRSTYHPSRGLREEEITSVIQSHLIVNPDIDTAEAKFLAIDGFKKFHAALKTQGEKEDFRAHLRRYMSIYLGDCPWEVSTTNRYTIVTHEASVTARRYIQRNETIKYLSGIQVMITPEEEKEMTVKKKDFSIVISARSKSASLFMGPARFANHDCNPNAKLVTTGHAGIEIVAIRSIDVGEEVTVKYGENYFGERNCECLCFSCEKKLVNGWVSAPSDNKFTTIAVKKSIEEEDGDGEENTTGYSLRRRRQQQQSQRPTRQGSVKELSRTPSATPDIRPRVWKTRRKNPSKSTNNSNDNDNTSNDTTVDAETPDGMNALDATASRKRKHDALSTPPITPAKKIKPSLAHQLTAIKAVEAAVEYESDANSDDRSPPSCSSTEPGDDSILTTATTPQEMDPDVTALETQIHGEMKCEEVEGCVEAVLASVAPFHGQMTPLSVSSDDVSRRRSITNTTTTTMTKTSEDSVTSTVAETTVAAFEEPDTHPATTTLTTSIATTVTTTSTELIATDSHMPNTTTQGNGIETPAPRQKRKYQRRQHVKIMTIPNRKREPGDYTLTPLLLAHPNMAWIHCTICNNAFVQEDAYFTRSSCPRCEKHSKLYGYMWPKTDKMDDRDREERVLDHRTVHRFLTTQDEARVRNRKQARVALPAVPLLAAEIPPSPLSHVRTNSANTNSPETTPTNTKSSAGLRRSGRDRRVSSKVLGQN